MTRSILREPARILLPLAAWAAMASFARFSLGAGAGAEASYLALIAAAVLLTVGALAVRPGVEVGVAALLTVAAVWGLPAGAARGAAVGLMLAVALALAGARRFRHDGGRLTWEAAVPIALGLQFLFRSGSLLRPPAGIEDGFALVALPLLAAMAVVVLGERVGWSPALLAAGVVLLVAGGAGGGQGSAGWTVTGTLVLLALAAVAWAGDKGGDPRLRLIPLAAVLVVATAIDPMAGVVLSLAVAGRVLATSNVGVAVAMIAAGGLAAVGPAARGWSEVLGSPGSQSGGYGLESLGSLTWIAILLPGALLLLRGRWRHLLIGLAVSVAAARIIPGAEALAAPLAFLALAIPVRERRSDAQWAWTGGLVLGAAVLSGYPWLREAPVADLLSLLRLDLLGLNLLRQAPGWIAAATVLVAFAVLGPLLGRWMRPAASTVGVLLVAAWVTLPAPGRVLQVEKLLIPDQPPLTIEVDPPFMAGGIVVDSQLSFGGLAVEGEAVARVRLTDSHGKSVDRLLRNGIDTGEWAARRPDVARQPGLVTPPAWVSWVTPGREFFGQRYRAVLWLEAPIEVSQIEVLLDPAAHPDIAIEIVHLELRP